MTVPNRWAVLLRQNYTKILASIVIGVAFWLVLRRGGLPIMPDDFGSVKWWTLPAYAATVAIWSTLRAARTRHLLRPVAPIPLTQILSVSWIGFLAIFVLPFRIGEVIRPALFKNKNQVSFATAAGACGAERIIDGLVLMTLLGVSLPLGGLLDPLPDHIGELPIPLVAVPAAAYFTLLLFVAAAIAMSVFFWRRQWARRTIDRLVGTVSKRLAAYLSDQVEKLSEGFRFLPSPRHIAPYMLETILYWTVAAAGMWMLAWGCGVSDITLTRSFALLGVLGLGIIVPGAPGYFGAFQGAIYAGLALYFPEDIVLSNGATFVFCLYAAQMSVMFIMAATSVFIGHGSRHTIHIPKLDNQYPDQLATDQPMHDHSSS